MTTLDRHNGRSAFRRLHKQVLGSALLLALAAGPALAVTAPAAQPAPSATIPVTAPPLAQPVIASAPAQDPVSGAATALANGAPGTAAAAPGRIETVLKRALALLGTPYRWGGTTTAGFDCSGLVGYVFRTTLGIELPRVSRDMANTGKLVERSHLSPGDLVFFGRRGRVDHVGIYLGDERFVHAPRTGRDVTVSSMDGGYWGNKFLEARRVAGI